MQPNENSRQPYRKPVIEQISVVPEKGMAISNPRGSMNDTIDETDFGSDSSSFWG